MNRLEFKLWAVVVWMGNLLIRIAREKEKNRNHLQDENCYEQEKKYGNFLPWWTPSTIAEVEKLLHGNMVAFEWGTGSSTLWLAQRCKQVITMEHDPRWCLKTLNRARNLGLNNISFNLRPLKDVRYYDEILKHKVDLTIIDGRNRVKCFKKAIKVSKIIMFDDTNKPRYREVFAFPVPKNSRHTEPNSEGRRATIWE